MHRLLVGVLAAIVGFSFGNAVPKWIENRCKNAPPGTPTRPVPHQQAPAKRSLLRRKPFRRFKFSSTRSGREGQVIETQPEEGVDSKPSDAKNPEKQVEKVCIFSVGSTSGTEDDTTGAVAQSCWKSRVSVARNAKCDKIEAPLLIPNSSAPAVAKGSLKLQIQEWKSKLKRLKNKALANEKLWGDKYEKPTLEQHYMAERLSSERAEAHEWEHKSLKKLSKHETKLVEDEGKACRLSQKEKWKIPLHSGEESSKKKPEFREVIGVLPVAKNQEISSVSRSQRREYGFVKERRKGDASTLDLHHALVQGRKADLER